jgi:hypothetical protein
MYGRMSVWINDLMDGLMVLFGVVALLLCCCLLLSTSRVPRVVHGWLLGDGDE